MADPIPAKAQELLEAMYQPLDDMHYYDADDSVLVGCDCGCSGDTLDLDEQDRRYEDAKAKLTELYHKLVEVIKSEGA